MPKEMKTEEMKTEEMKTEVTTQSAGERAEARMYTAEEHQAELNRVGAKEAREAKQAILKKLGLSSEDGIAALVESAKAANNQKKPEQNPEQTPNQDPNQNEVVAELMKRLEALERSNEQAQAELIERKQIDRMRELNVPEEDFDYYQIKALRLTGGDVTFDMALDEVIKNRPPQIRPPEVASGVGKSPVTSMTLDDYKKLSYTEKIKLKEEKPTVFEHFKKLMGF